MHILKHTELALERLKTAEPVQYILGYAWFLDYKIKVNKDVLIPRPETEELVTQLLYNNKKFTGTILDIGTGSGCIAITIKRLLPEAKIFAVDVSAAALNVAKQNAKDNKCEINFIEDDILNPDFKKYPDKVDIIISNPPYISEKEKEEMHANVLKYEPHLALFTDDDSLQFYKAILSFAKKKLKKQGELYLELNSEYAEAVFDLYRVVQNYLHV